MSKEENKVVEGKVTEEKKVEETKVEAPIVEPPIMAEPKGTTLKEDFAQIGRGLANLGKKAVSGAKKAAPWVAGIGAAALAAKVYSDYKKGEETEENDDVVDGSAEEVSDDDVTTTDF